MSPANNRSGGIGFFGLLSLILIGLKLAEVGAVASWSWLWVLAPLWLPLVCVLSGVGVAALFYLATKGRR